MRRKGNAHHPTFLLAICISAASNAPAGRLEPADLRTSVLKKMAPFRRTEGLATFAKVLRKAGLPE